MNRLTTPQTARVKSRNLTLFKEPKTKAEALMTINSIYKPKLASLDSRVHTLKCKKKLLAHLELELMLLAEKEETVIADNSEEESFYSDSSEERYDTNNYQVRGLVERLRKENKKLFEIHMVQDSFKHMLDRDELILYHKKKKINNIQEKINKQNKKSQGKFQGLNIR